eukprot:8097657-Pyramimonas_sp.AAC.1
MGQFLPLGSLLGVLAWGPLGPAWAPLGPSWGSLGRLGMRLEASWAVLERSCGCLRPSWSVG